jgi:very-short-patch-repair endonuclease
MVHAIPKDKLVYGRQLRKNPTAWEKKLWQHLKEKNLGVRFKRQVYVGGYLVDLSCHAKKLIIEIDGSHHRNPDRRLRDQERLDFLKSRGYRVLRFWNGDVDKT